MHTNYLEYLCSVDNHLAEIIKVVGTYSIKIRTDSYLSLVEAIIYQQLAGSAASAIYNRFLKYYNDPVPKPEQILSSSETDLRAKVGISRMKIAYLKDLSARIVDGRLVLNSLSSMTDEEIITQLTQGKGIGRWTAEMHLMFYLGREDILPVTDLGLRTAMKKTYVLDDLPKPNKMMEIANPWRPYRSVATWYLWKSLFKKNSNVTIG